MLYASEVGIGFVAPMMGEHTHTVLYTCKSSEEGP